MRRCVVLLTSLMLFLKTWPFLTFPDDGICMGFFVCLNVGTIKKRFWVKKKKKNRNIHSFFLFFLFQFRICGSEFYEGGTGFRSTCPQVSAKKGCEIVSMCMCTCVCLCACAHAHVCVCVCVCVCVFDIFCRTRSFIGMLFFKTIRFIFPPAFVF